MLLLLLLLLLLMVMMMMMMVMQELIELYNAEHEDEIRQARELHEQLLCKRLKARYNKHYAMCRQVVSDVVDFSTKIAEYRSFTNQLVRSRCYTVHH